MFNTDLSIKSISYPLISSVFYILASYTLSLYKMSLTICIKRMRHTKELFNIRVPLTIWSCPYSLDYSFMS
jgi:hypothetical protein